MARKHKKVLRKKIILIMCTLIGTIILVYVIGIFLLRGYVRQVRDITDKTVTFYASEMDRELDNINSQLVNVLITNRTIKEIAEIGMYPQENTVVHSIARQNELNDFLESLSINYGSEYHFWFYNAPQDILLVTGEGDYVQKELFKKKLRSAAAEGEIPLTEKRNWFLQEAGGNLMLTSTFAQDGNYVGCWALPERKFSVLLGLEHEDDTTIFLKDLQTGTEYHMSDETGRKPSHGGMEEKIPEAYFSEYRFEHAAVSVSMNAYDDLHRQAFFYELMMGTVAVFIVAIYIWIHYYSKAAVLKPLQVFAQNLKRFEEEGELGQSNNYEEFEKVGEVLWNLEKEIKHLQVRVYEEQLERQKTKIDYLQLQIRPHFYINCLNSIYSMAQLKHTDEIQELAAYVSGYMRSVFRKGSSPICLEEELQQIESYVRIHKILYRYDCSCNIDVNTEILSAQVPPFLIMIFIENCVKYTIGIGRKIRIGVQGDFEDGKRQRIWLRISDNGNGFTGEILDKINSQTLETEDERFQIGIRNIRERLRILYGQDACLHIGNGTDGGAEIMIKIPFDNGEESQ